MKPCNCNVCQTRGMQLHDREGNTIAYVIPELTPEGEVITFTSHVDFCVASVSQGEHQWNLTPTPLQAGDTLSVTIVRP